MRNAPRPAVRTAATLAAAVVAVVTLSPSARATGVWSGAAVPTDGLWSNPANWDTIPGATDGTTVSPDIATFTGTPASVAVTVDPNRNVAGLIFDSGAIDGGNAASSPFTIGSTTGNALYLSNGGTVQVNANNTFNANGSTLTNVNQTISAPLSLAGASYTLSNNAPTGTTTVGLVVRGDVRPVGSISTPVTLTLTGTNIGISNGAASANVGASQVTGNLKDGVGGAKLGIVKNGTGTWELRGVNTYSGDTVINQGVLRFIDNSDTGEPASPNTHIIVNSGGTLRVSGNTVNSATVVTALSPVELRTGGVIQTSNSTTPLNLKSDAGPALYFNFSAGAAGTASYVISAAPVNLLGTTPAQGGIKLSAAAGQAAVNLGGTGTATSLGTVLRPFDIAVTGKTDVSSGAAVDYDFRIRGPLSGTGGILKLGPGTLRLDNGTQSWSGTLDIRQGTVNVNGSVSLTSNVSLSVSGGGDFHTYGTQTHTLSGVTVAAGILSSSSNASTIKTNSVTLNPAATETATVDTVLADNTAAATVTKNGAGTATLTGINTYTGVTTVSGGTLVLKGSGARDNVVGAGRAGATVQSGATLSFDYDGLHNGGSVRGQIVSLLQTGMASNFSSGVIRAASPAATRGFGWRDDGNAVLVTPAYYGDLNFDGKVNADDYALLDRGFAQYAAGTIAPGTATWSQGDVNYDNLVDQNDYLRVDTTYAATGVPHEALDALFAQRQSQFGDSYVAALTAAVPEPATLSLLATALPLLARRRRA